MVRHTLLATLLTAFSVNWFAIVPVRAEGLFGGPDQKLDSAQKAYDVGTVQKFLPLGQVQKAHDFSPLQRAYAPLPPVQKSGPMQKMADPACCCPSYSCIRYHHHHLLRKRCCSHHSPVQSVLSVQDPRHCCCHIDIPVCISSCCTGSPQVRSHVGLLGCGYVTYRWCCGFTVKVVFRKSGDIVVHTYGL